MPRATARACILKLIDFITENEWKGIVYKKSHHGFSFYSVLHIEALISIQVHNRIKPDPGKNTWIQIPDPQRGIT